MSFIKNNFFGGNERDAARDQVEAGDRALDFQREGLATARSDLQPFRNAGNDVLNQLLEVAKGGNSEFDRTEGFRDIQNSSAARGKLVSGGTLKELTRFNSGLNERNRNNRFNRLFNVASLGANAASNQASSTLNTASNQGNIAIGQGNAKAAGRIGAGNAIRSTTFDLARIAAGGA